MECGTAEALRGVQRMVAVGNGMDDLLRAVCFELAGPARWIRWAGDERTVPNAVCGDRI